MFNNSFLHLGLSLIVAAGCSHLFAADSNRPNIVVFLVDDMGVMDTSVPMLTDDQGRPKRFPLNDFYRTPNMESLAERGIRFSNFHAMSVCSPTRISIMTGQNAARHHATNWINPDANNRGPQGPLDWAWEGLNKQSVTLARLLQASGYRTIHVGKGHFGPRANEGAEPKNLGFDENVGGASFGSPGSYYSEKNFGAGTPRQSSAVPGLEKYHGSGTFLTEALTLEANRLVSAAVEADQPFFLYFAHYAVHAPFESDPRFAANYKNSGKPKNAQAFATLIEGMDESLGDVMQHLVQLGVAEDTLIVFLGDNGSDSPLGEAHNVGSSAPLRGKKGSHYEGGTRVPFIAAWGETRPENTWQKRLPIPANAVQRQMATVCDLFPTLLSVAQVATPGDHPVDGLTLVNLLQGKSDSQHPTQFLMHYPHSPHRSDYFTVWRNGDWKVVYHFFPSPASGGSHYQLFNLANDPFEQIDLSKQAPDKLRDMVVQLQTELQQHDAQLPISKEKESLSVQIPEAAK